MRRFVALASVAALAAVAAAPAQAATPTFSTPLPIAPAPRGAGRADVNRDGKLDVVLTPGPLSMASTRLVVGKGDGGSGSPADIPSTGN